MITHEQKTATLWKAFFPKPPPADLSDIPLATYPQEIPFEAQITIRQIRETVNRLNPDKAPGPDEISNRLGNIYGIDWWRRKSVISQGTLSEKKGGVYLNDLFSPYFGPACNPSMLYPRVFYLHIHFRCTHIRTYRAFPSVMYMQTRYGAIPSPRHWDISRCKRSSMFPCIFRYFFPLVRDELGSMMS